MSKFMRIFLVILPMWPLRALPAAEMSDTRWEAQIQEEAKVLPGSPVVTIDGSQLAGFKRPLNAEFGTSEVVEVTGQPFSKAIRVKVLQRTNPPWLVQIVTPVSITPIRKGDTLFAVCHVRCTESTAESGGGSLAGYLQLPREPWTDYGGLSASPGKPWQKLYRSFEASDDRKAGDLEISFHLGRAIQTLELGGFAVFNLGQHVDAAKLPVSKVTYAGRELDAAWRKPAQERIEKFRKGDFEVRVTDPSGRPVPNASVRVRMLRHAYQFGTFLEDPALWDNADGLKYRETLRKLFNRVTVPLYWEDWGWDSPEGRDRYLKLARWAHDEGLHTRGHNLIWPGWSHTPTWLRTYENDPRRLRNIINASIAERVALFRQFEFDDYDVINELRDNHRIVDILGDDEAARWFKLVHSIDPKPKPGINECSIIAAGGNTEVQQAIYEEHLRMLLGHGAPLGVIGVQCHMGEDMTPPQRIVEILDRFAKFGIPIQATEFDINTDDEDAQGDYMRDFLTAFFSHPATEAITQWGFWQGRHWIPRAALFRKDWSVKPSGKAFMDLVLKTWWTDAQGTTGSDGSFRTRGFLGDYEVVVKVNGVSRTLSAKVCRGGSLLKVRL